MCIMYKIADSGICTDGVINYDFGVKTFPDGTVSVLVKEF